MRSVNESPEQAERAAAPDVPLSLAEALVSALALRDLLRLRVYYPRAVRTEDAEEMRLALAGHLRAALADAGFDDIRPRLFKRGLDAPSTDEDLTLLITALALRVPGVLPTDPNTELVPDAMRKAFAACQERIGPPLKDLAHQLVEMRLYDCRIPEGDPTFSDPRRSLQLLRSYWSVCRSVVLHQIDACVGYHPHPLQRIIVSCRARIDGHLARLEDGEGSREAKGAMDTLLDIVLGGEPDDLSAAPEWTRQQVQAVEGFLENARLRAGSKVFPLTHEEEVFIAHAEGEVQRYIREIDTTWARMLATSKSKSTLHTDVVAAPTAAVPASSGVPDAAVPRTGVPASPPRQEPSTGPTVAGGPGQPCLGLPRSAIRVVRVYKEWETRREKRRGLPAPPTVDDLVAETEMARATVIGARKALLRELILEQTPDARPGTLRLTTRGLRLELSSETGTVQSSVQ